MPGMNGVDFLKTYLKNKGIPTILITSVSMEEGPLVMEALSNGAMTYIQKPEAKNIQSTKKELEQALHQAAKNTTKTRDYSNVKPKRTESFLTLQSTESLLDLLQEEE